MISIRRCDTVTSWRERALVKRRAWGGGGLLNSVDGGADFWYVWGMEDLMYDWDETKRVANIEKHEIDFYDIYFLSGIRRCVLTAPGMERCVGSLSGISVAVCTMLYTRIEEHCVA